MNVKVDSERGSYTKTLMIFFFPPQGLVHVLEVCHKCGSGHDGTPTMHLHSGNKGYINFIEATEVDSEQGS